MWTERSPDQAEKKEDVRWPIEPAQPWLPARRDEVQSLPKTMKAVRIHGYGGPEVLELEEAACPRPAAGEILVRVHAAGVNPVDWKVREGHLKTLCSIASR